MLDASPELQCFTGPHAWLVCGMLVVVPFWAFLLLPFAAAEGDLSLVQPPIWCKPRQWLLRRADKAKGLDLGKMQPSPNMLCVWAELLANILLPTIAVLSSAHPLRNALASFVVCTCLMVVTCWSPPKLDRDVNVVVHTSHLLACVAFGAATVSVLIDDPTSWTAPILLYGGMASVLLCAAFLLISPCRSPAVDYSQLLE